ncbi:MAG TPA: PIG-L family deacetylase [Thermoanaerobaculia bacterium]
MTRLRSFHILLLVAASLALAASAVAALPGGDRAAPGGGALADIPPGTVLWVGAHPDDEVLLAPLLGELCGEGRHPCVLLVATRGENGACRLPGGCHPDLATVRTAEMRAAARLFRARLLQGSLPDVFGPDPAAVRQAWADAAGGEEQLLDRLAGAIDGVAPQTIIAFDPRHGTTCHNAHRAIGRLVLRAVERLGQPAPEVFLLESRVHIAPGGTSIRFSAAAPGDPALLRFDGNTPLRPGPGTAWDFLLDDARRQPSQFDATFLSSLLAVPPTHREVYLLPAAALATDPSPIDPCAP